MIRTARLQRKGDISAVFRRGTRHHHRLATLVIYKKTAENVPNRFCFSASKKVGNAVQRNKAKRLLREAVRLHYSTFAQSHDCVFIAKSATSTASYQEVEEAVLHLCKRANLSIESLSSAENL